MFFEHVKCVGTKSNSIVLYTLAGYSFYGINYIIAK